MSLPLIISDYRTLHDEIKLRTPRNATALELERLIQRSLAHADSPGYGGDWSEYLPDDLGPALDALRAVPEPKDE